MTLKKLLRMNKCIYDVCWKGECGESVEDGSDFCSEHINKKCKCGNQSNGDCHKYNGSFVCGTPLCDVCKETHIH